METQGVDRLAASVRAHPACWSLGFTFVFCVLVAALLSLAGGRVISPEILVVSFSVGFSVHVCICVGHLWWAPRVPRVPQLVVTFTMLGCGLVLGLAVGGALTEGRPLLFLRSNYSLPLGALLGLLTIGGFYVMENWWDARARLARAERDTLARDKALAEAELRVLQAQVEPHFLFNTLANVDYLLKPVMAPRLEETVTRLKRWLAGGKRTGIDPTMLDTLIRRLADAPAWLSWLRVGQGDRVELVAVDDVCFFRADRKYTAAVTRETEHLTRTPLAELAARLDPERFWRIHRGCIVNAAAIASARRDLRGRYRLTLKDRPEILRVSAAYRHLFRRT